MKARSIVMTGATGGLGAALVSALAEPGVTFLLCGRDEDRLEAVSDAARSQGAEVLTLHADLRLREGRQCLTEAIIRNDQEAPIDLLIVNAGVKVGNRNGVEDADQMERIIAVNLTAAMQTVQAVLPAMRQRGRGQIALVGSLAARAPQADLLSYSATKAGLAAYAVGLRRVLRGSGVSVSLVLPGFVDTPMTHRHIGAAPFLMTADQAALRITKGLARGRSTIAFPFRLVGLLFLSNLLPARVSDWIDGHFRATILPDHDEASSRGEPPSQD